MITIAQDEAVDLERQKALAVSAIAEKNRRLTAKACASLAGFSQSAWPLCNTATLDWNWHHDLICEYLTLCFQRKIKRLILNVPPRSSKSNVASINFPAWCWTQDPALSFVVATYEIGLATDFSTKRRTLIDSAWYQGTWPDSVEFTQDQNAKTQYRNTKLGEMIATSIGGAITGKGGNFLIIDDPVNPKQAFSEVERTSANRDFDSTFRSRLNDPKNDVIIIIMQRTHEDDLTGHVLAALPGEWTHISLPMVAEKDETWVFPISGRVVKRKRGELLQEHRWDAHWCDTEKVTQGPYTWAGQYQQRPAPLEGGIIKRDWIQYYRRADLEDIMAKRDDGCQSWDPAFKDLKTSAFVAGHVWARSGPNYFLVARKHDHLDIIKTCDGISEFARDYPWANAKYVEDKANGPAIIQLLKDKIIGLIAVEVGRAEGDKVARLHAVAPTFASLHVWVPHPDECPWVVNMVNEWCTAPNAAYWDDTDAMTQALSNMKPWDYGFLDYFKSGRAAQDAEKMGATGAPPKVEQIMQQQAAARAPGTPSNCPECKAESVGRVGSDWRCQQCGHQWSSKLAPAVLTQSRTQLLHEARR